MLDAMNGIQQSMQALPQILELVDKCTNDSEAMKRLTGWLPPSLSRMAATNQGDDGRRPACAGGQVQPRARTTGPPVPVQRGK